MMIAGEASGDALAADLVVELRRQILSGVQVYSADLQPVRTGLNPRFFGAGGVRMEKAGVEMAFDMTQHSVIGLSDVLKKYLEFRKLFHQLLELAQQRQPDLIIGVDFGGFNLRFGNAIRKRIRRGAFKNWQPKLVQFVSPQVWASRAGRAYQLQADYDLVLSIFPFEKDWYAQRVPDLRVEFVGHPLLDRVPIVDQRSTEARRPDRLLLLPGSRRGELRRHLPVMLEALRTIKASKPDVEPFMVLPTAGLVELARSMGADPSLPIQVGDLHGALSEATVAIASTGTVTMECAVFGVPTVTLYRTSWSTYQIAKRLVTVSSLTMPNLLARKTVFPEFIQDAATPENLARAALDLLTEPMRRDSIRVQLRSIIGSLGGPGAIRRAADAVLGLLSLPAAQRDDAQIH